LNCPSPPSPAQPSPAQSSPAQPNPAQPGPARPSPSQPCPAQPSPVLQYLTHHNNYLTSISPVSVSNSMYLTIVSQILTYLLAYLCISPLIVQAVLTCCRHNGASISPVCHQYLTSISSLIISPLSAPSKYGLAAQHSGAAHSGAAAHW
jgi:hypothetical protein